jgi:hypothetical protein
VAGKRGQRSAVRRLGTLDYGLWTTDSGLRTTDSGLGTVCTAPVFLKQRLTHFVGIALRLGREPAAGSAREVPFKVQLLGTVRAADIDRWLTGTGGGLEGSAHRVEIHLPANEIKLLEQAVPVAISVVVERVAPSEPRGDDGAGVLLVVIRLGGILAPRAGLVDPVAEEIFGARAEKRVEVVANFQKTRREPVEFAGIALLPRGEQLPAHVVGVLGERGARDVGQIQPVTCQARASLPES